ncbi:MAG: CHASE2 domain-containing protein [Bryobacterales bacterium]|nr:CHASE2 domain-containing protein [Bryobacterales bacterium]
MRRFTVAVPILVAVSIVFMQPVWLVGLERRYFDLLIPLAARNSHPSQVIVVEIDQESLRKVGRWPWSRAVIGRLVESAFEAKASVVVTAMLFSETDAQDPQLAEGLRRGRAVVGGYFGFDGNRTQCDHPMQPLASAPVNSTLFRASRELCVVPSIADSARVGFLNASSDADGVLRRLPLLIEYQRNVYPSFALSGALAAVNAYSLRFSAQGQPELEVGGRPVPLDSKGCLLVQPGTRPFARMAAADVLDGKASTAALRGKVVVIGGSAVGLQDSVPVPGQKTVPGVYVQAAALDHLLRGDFVSRPPWGMPLELLSVLLAGALAAVGLREWSAKWAALSTGGAILLLGGMSVAAVTSAGILLSPLMAQVTVAAVAFLGQQSRAGAMRRHAAEIQAFMVTSLEALSTLRESTDPFHSGQIRQYMRLLCDACATQPRLKRDLTPETIELMVQLSPIRDVGKAGIPDRILNKAGALGADELELMKQHVQLGLQILEQARKRSGLRDERLFQVARDLVYSHHERWDGSGYPRKLRGDEIPLAGRILAVADVYDALVHERPYKPSVPHAQAVAMIVAGRGTLFDPEVVDAFVATEQAWQGVAAIE